jgi:GNAT superfamily N-acetyltransferase
MDIEIYTITENSQYSAIIDKWSCGLWWNNFEEAGIEFCFVAYHNDMPIGFQTINSDNRCIAIEVHPDYQGRGIASKLIQESGCYIPDRNENKEFWERIKEKYEEF